MSIAEKITQLKKEIPPGIQLVLVTKTVPVSRMTEAFKAGASDFGENRVQELLSKKKEWKAAGLPEMRWHMIGHLQTNKVKQILGEVALIQSLDRSELVKEIETQAERKKMTRVDCLIQIKTSGEPSKQGLPAEQAVDFAAGISKNSPIRISGLMTIGPLTDNEAEIRSSFQTLKRLQSELREKCPGKGWDILSMGMSGDYGIAIEEGSNMLRIGRSVFGERMNS